MIWDLEAITHKKVDLVSNAGLSPYIKPYIDKQKKLLYEIPILTYHFAYAILHSAGKENARLITLYKSL